uniref:Mohawk homeobox b n=1 Tax=Xiphophorus couchianus TaxID=32473 RepID=A0A3B5LNE3_9TELE
NEVIRIRQDSDRYLILHSLPSGREKSRRSGSAALDSPKPLIYGMKYLSCSSPRSRLGGVKARHKRQVLQDMARPLKHWLYKHRDNPYPTKTEKVLLALGSHMTLVQVSNWFANARRRLKNTVRQPDLSWALRIKLYNKYIQGNAERLSVCSDDTNSDGEPSRNAVQKASVLAGADFSNEDDGTSPPSKYKSSLLNRYLNDTLRHMMAAKADAIASAHGKRCLSQSFSSNECDRDVVSPDSSTEAEANFIYSTDTTDNTSVKSCSRNPPRKDGQGWREIHAAVALTSLAQGKSAGTALTSRIIQKSSHISEVQTVKAPLANTG